MSRQIFFLLAFALPNLLFAQGRQALKVDLGPLVQKGARLAYEFKLNQKSSLELSFGFQKHENQPDWLFNGDQIIHYLQRKLDTFDYAGRFVNSSGWQNVESAPLPNAPEAWPLESANFRLGWRFNFEKECSKWRFFLQPGLMISGLRFYTIDGNTRLEQQVKDQWVIGEFPYFSKIKRESAVYEQTRFMRLYTKWMPGLTYDLGFRRSWGKHFFLEGRVSAGGNLAVPFKNPRPPITLRGLWVQPVVMAGWAFGKGKRARSVDSTQ